MRERSGGLCERCLFVFAGEILHSSPMAAVHHLTYAHIGNEPLEELQAVCRDCHDYLSATSDVDPRAAVLDGFAAGALVKLGLLGPWLKATLDRLYDHWKARGYEVESLMQLLPGVIAAARKEGLLPQETEDEWADS